MLFSTRRARGPQFVVFLPRTGWPAGRLIWVRVGSMIVSASRPGTIVDDDRVRSPCEAGTTPAPGGESGADGNAGTKCDPGSQSYPRPAEDNQRIIDRHVVESW